MNHAGIICYTPCEEASVLLISKRMLQSKEGREVKEKKLSQLEPSEKSAQCVCQYTRAEEKNGINRATINNTRKRLWIKGNLVVARDEKKQKQGNCFESSWAGKFFSLSNINNKFAISKCLFRVQRLLYIDKRLSWTRLCLQQKLLWVRLRLQNRWEE